MQLFFGLVFLVLGLVLLPIPATMLFGVTYLTSLAAVAVGVAASLTLSLGVGLLKNL